MRPYARSGRTSSRTAAGPSKEPITHVSITTTERYDNQTLEALQAATKLLDDGKGFDTTASSSDGTKFQESFNIDSLDQSRVAEGADANPLKDCDLKIGSGTVNHISLVTH